MSAKVDDFAKRMKPGAVVHGEWDCMLNQTNIGQNNNKYYVIQLLKDGNNYYVFNRWGRVGEPGQNAMKGPFSSPDDAVKEFKKKFSEKSGNQWDNRDNFVSKPGKYTLIEIDHSATAEQEAKLAAKANNSGDASPKKVTNNYASCTLPEDTQKLLRLIFDEDMFKSAMADFEIDVKKMPLGALKKSQIAKGYEVLLQLQDEIKNKNRSRINQLSGTFYTLIPHAFGRRTPPPIDTAEMIQAKMDMLNVLADIELAQGLEAKEQAPKQEGLQEHPLDKHYRSLNADVVPLDKNSEEYKKITTYLENTKPSWRQLPVVAVYKLNRKDEGKRFAEHASITNRRLLWHGTNVAVVAAIINSGLRIMPHSGGRVGKGIYLASENAKSAGYVRPAQNTGIMFLAEAALGKEHFITRDDSSLVRAPPGFDSIIAKGHTEPDPALDTELEIDGYKVKVPQGKPIRMSQYQQSSFSQSEYLLYKESQARLRYILMLKWN